jgi:diguanylate cyclase (GGDEF)-like protein
VLPGASVDKTRGRAESLRESVKRLNPRHKKQSLGAFTISAGVAVFPDHGTSVDTVLKAADTALYAAKNSGRDRVVVAAPAEPIS